MSDHPLDRPDPEDETIVLPASKFLPRRSLNATHPMMLRTGLIIFLAGGVWSAALGALTNVFPREEILGSLQKFGMAVMLLGMVTVLFCFPTARSWVTLPLRWAKALAGNGAAARLIVGYCAFILLMVAATFGLWMSYHVVPTMPITLFVLPMLAVFAFYIHSPIGARPFFGGALLPAILFAIPVMFETVGRGRGWFLSLLLTDNDAAMEFLFMLLLCTIPCGFVGLFAAWIARMVGANPSAMDDHDIWE